MADEGPDTGIVILEFSVTDTAYPFVGLSAAEDCRVTLERMLPREEGEYAEFFSVLGADADQVLAVAEEHDLVEPSLVNRYDDGGLFEFVVDGFCPARGLAERGAIPRTVESVAGQGTMVAEVPAEASATAVIESFLGAHPSVELVSKRSADRISPLLTQEDLQRAVDERLTDRQRDALTTAFDLGYYEPTGGASGEAVADALGISPSTVSQHLQAAERKLVSVLLEDKLLGGTGAAG